jgi:putative addiction module killer protein
MAGAILEYQSAAGVSAFGGWFNELDPQAAAKVTVALQRMRQGNLSNAKSVGAGILEYRIDFGPGYRIYFGKDGEEIVVLLGGGTKRRQQHDISMARERWADYRRRKKGS